MFRLDTRSDGPDCACGDASCRYCGSADAEWEKWEEEVIEEDRETLPANYDTDNHIFNTDRKGKPYSSYQGVMWREVVA